MVFVNSMSDLFHKDVPDEYILAVVRVMRTGQLAHLPGADQAIRAAAGPAPDEAAGRRRRAAHLVGRQRREPPPRAAPDRAPASRPRRGCGSCPIEPLLEDLGPIDLGGIAWVIVGGESGHGARPMDPAWVRIDPGPVRGRRRPVLLQAVGRGAQEAAGRELDGQTYDEMPDSLGLPMPELRERQEMIAQVESMVPSLS